jgi:hypothetical protein
VPGGQHNLIAARPAERIGNRGVQRNHGIAVARAEQVVRCGRRFDRLRETFPVREKRRTDMTAVNMELNCACPLVKTA